MYGNSSINKCIDPRVSGRKMLTHQGKKMTIRLQACGTQEHTGLLCLLFFSFSLFCANKSEVLGSWFDHGGGPSLSVDSF